MSRPPKVEVVDELFGVVVPSLREQIFKIGGRGAFWEAIIEPFNRKVREQRAYKKAREKHCKCKKK